MLVESWTFEQWYSEAGQLREGQSVPASLVLDLDVALLDVDVGLAVLAHRPELDQVAVGDVVADREEQVEVADHVGVLGLDRLLARGHRVGRRGLLAVVDDRLGADLGDDAVEEVAVLDRADEAADLLAGELLPGGDPLVEIGDRRQRAGAGLIVPAAAGEVVDDRDLVAASREPQSRRPAQVAVAPKNENAHRSRQGTGRGRHSIRPMTGLAARNGGRVGLAALAAILLLGWACGSTTPGTDGRPSTTQSPTRRSPRNLDARRGLHRSAPRRRNHPATTPPACRCWSPASTS